MGRITLREAKIRDIWRDLYQKKDKRALQTLDITFSGVAELGSGDFRFDNPINLICGENGVGKSAAIWLIARALQASFQAEGAHRFGPPRAQSGTIQQCLITIKTKGKTESLLPQEAKDKLSVNDVSPVFAIIDSGAQVPHLVDQLRSDSNPNDLIEGISPVKLEEEEIKKVNSISGKEYDSIQIFEIEDYGNLPLFPFFVVSYGATTYNSLSMGSGELALLMLFWKLRSLPHNSIALIEEPESFAAPRSQRGLTDYMAALCLEKGHMMIISSHSGTIAERIPNKAITLASRTRENVAFITDPSPRLLVERIALYIRNRFILLVEDSTALAFTKALITHLDSRVANDIDIFHCNSCSKVETVLQYLDSTHKERTKFVAVFDGDQRETPIKTLNWPHIFLPGKLDPDTELRTLVQNLSPDSLALLLHKQKHDLITLQSGIEGVDNHDWINNFVQQLGVHKISFAQKLIGEWVSKNPADTKQFADDLYSALGLK